MESDPEEQPAQNEIKKEGSNDSNDESNKSGDEWIDIDKDGWENVLGSGRLRRRIINSSNHNDASEQGQSARPTKGDVVKVSLKGQFNDTVFDEHEAFEFNCEEGEVIRALDLVVPLMHLGETDEFIADPELAFGDFGAPPHLPPKASVHYTVTLLEHNPGSSPMDFDVPKRMEIGLRKKDRGNYWFARGDYSMAVQCYRKAAEYFDDDNIEIEVPMDRYHLEQPLQDLITEQIKAYNNLAQAQLKLEAFDAALASLRNVLKLDPNNEKALFRKAKAFVGKNDTELAIGTLRRVTRLYKDNKLAQSELQRLLGKEAQYKEKSKNLSKKMLGLDKYEAEQQENKKQGRWEFVKNILIATAVVASAAGLAYAGLGGAANLGQN